MTGRELILATETKTLIGAVMMLTGGSANPAVVEAQAERIKREVAEPPKTRPATFGGI